MNTRRGFLGSLFAAPFLSFLLPKAKASVVEVRRGEEKTEWYLHQPVYLPIGCDLSFSSLQWAFDVAKENNFGKPKFVLIGPENKFLARDMLGTIPVRPPYTGDSEVNCLYQEMLRWEVKYVMPFNTWKVVFERGVVISEGPR